jgi:hypothetical protein
MRCSRSSRAKPWLNVAGGLVLSVPGVPALGGDIARNLTLPGDRDSILQIDLRDRPATLAVHTAITGAFQRLGSPACQDVLSEFTDQSGRPLKENLLRTGQTPQEYLGLLSYTDGAGQAPCGRPGILAFTSPGTRIVYVCGRFRDRFLTLRLKDREELELALIHEALHTLGLGENPPSPQEISEKVRLRCASR